MCTTVSCRTSGRTEVESTNAGTSDTFAPIRQTKACRGTNTVREGDAVATVSANKIAAIESWKMERLSTEVAEVEATAWLMVAGTGLVEP